jgi:hypothetical protein
VGFLVELGIDWRKANNSSLASLNCGEPDDTNQEYNKGNRWVRLLGEAGLLSEDSSRDEDKAKDEEKSRVNVLEDQTWRLHAADVLGIGCYGAAIRRRAGALAIETHAWGCLWMLCDQEGDGFL